MRTHLVGSLGLANAGDVFETVSDKLGHHCVRIPDGETGVRSGWVRWQSAHLDRNEDIERISVTESIPGFIKDDGVARIFYRLRSGVQPDALRFGELGYAREAQASWSIFEELARKGEIRPGTRFQVSLPTPVGLACAFFIPDDRPAAERAFGRALERELAAIQSSIPNAKLSIQWDAVFEVIGSDQGTGLHYASAFDGSVERLAALCDLVAPEAEAGMHLCYGDAGNKHIIEPNDLSVAVRLVQAIRDGMSRSLDFVHMPVPVSRSDSAYFEALDGADFEYGTRLILGLVHDKDGFDATRARIDTARRFAPTFDIATECGFGRRDPGTIAELLDLHRRLCEAYD